MIILRLFLIFLFFPALILSATTTRRFARELRILLFLGLLIVIAVLIIHPKILESLAQVLGVNSALDLVVFFITVGFFTFGFYVSGKFERYQQKLSALTCEFALLEYQLRTSSGKNVQALPDPISREGTPPIQLPTISG